MPDDGLYGRERELGMLDDLLDQAPQVPAPTAPRVPDGGIPKETEQLLDFLVGS